MKLSDEQRLNKICEYGNKLLAYISDRSISKEDLLKDYALQWLVSTPLYNIGEQAYMLSDTFKKGHQNVPWSMVSGLHHRLVHDYDGTNWSIISDVVFDELPKLLKDIENLNKHESEDDEKNDAQ